MSADYSALCSRLGLQVDAEMLRLALTHRSFAYESGGLPTNERLEFLGDAVLSIVITEELYRRHPDVSEGQLAKYRSAVVNARALAKVAVDLGLGDFLLLGKGEETTGGRHKASILADTVEAVLGAVYLNHGLDPVRSVVLKHFDSLLNEATLLGAGLDWKTSLQELCSEYSLPAPKYLVTEEGPDHAKVFEAQAAIGDLLYGHGRGTNKKLAEQQAAAAAYAELQAEHEVAAGE